MSGGILAPQRPNTPNLTGLSDPLSTRARIVDGNKYYIAELYQVSTGLSFRAFVPETFTIAIQNNWEPLFGGFGDSAVGRGATALGTPINLKYLTRRVWTGTEPLTFSFTFFVDAYASTERDVQKPVENLLKMSTPIRDGIFLKSPGPTLFSDTNRIYLRIGKFLVLDSVVLDHVDITFFTIADKTNGKYMSADINVTISTAYTPDQNDILNYFLRGQSGDNSLDPANRALTMDKLVNDLSQSYNSADRAITGNGINTLDNFVSPFNFNIPGFGGSR